ncbi:MAG: hypothetical protein JWO13_3772 [Acidobacteriales bacterium]|nr:hypothetical protein [Terriglobales bacterium]
MICQEHMAELADIFPGASCIAEAGIEYILLPNAELPVGCSPTHVDLLLCPAGRDGYPSRLFAAQVVQTRVQRNWHQTSVIAGRTWVVFSWRVNQTDLNPVQILSAHLEALR